MPLRAFILVILAPIPPFPLDIAQKYLQNSPLEFSVWWCLVVTAYRVVMVTFCACLQHPEFDHCQLMGVGNVPRMLFCLIQRAGFKLITSGV